MPKVSVIIATHNRSRFICDAIDSVLIQTFNDFEIIVVDDGSTDDTKQALTKYGPSINYLYQKNQGRAQARNSGIKLAKGEYLAFLDDDDIWLPQKLEKQVNFLDLRHDVGLVHTFSGVIDGKGNFLKKKTKIIHRLYKKAMKAGYDYQGMSRACIMFLSTIMLRRDCLGKSGFFDPDIPAFEDWDFYLRFALEYAIGTLPEVLVEYRLHSGNTAENQFTVGRIKTAFKHLAVLDKQGRNCSQIQAKPYFYIHLANAYYIDRQYRLFRKYTLKALKLNPFLFFSRLSLHFPLSFMRKPKLAYSERIIPQETQGASLGAHLKRYDFAEKFCNKGTVVLDAACGVGYGSRYLSEAANKVIGIDICKEAIDFAKAHYQKENISFENMDVKSLDFADKYFDMACAFEILEHLDDIERFVSEVKRVLKDEGILIISTPNVKKTHNNPRNPHHKREFCRLDLELMLKKYFKKVEIFGQRRLQSNLHYYLLKFDILHLRSLLPVYLRRNISHALSSRSWDEAGLEDFVITKEGMKRAIGLIGVCKK